MATPKAANDGGPEHLYLYIVGTVLANMFWRCDALDSYIQADLLHEGMKEILNRLRSKKFDNILLLDVIEHLLLTTQFITQ